MAMFHKRNPPIGSRPGTLAIPPDAPPPQIRCTTYDKEHLDERAVDDVASLDRDHKRVDWVDVRGLGDEQVLRGVADTFSIHPLALEDAVNAPQRAKAEAYEQNLLIIARTPIRDDAGRLRMMQVSIVVGADYVVTFMEHDNPLFEPIRARIREGMGPIRAMGPDYLAYALLDVMIDNYYPVASDLSAQLDDLETAVLEGASREILAKIYRARRDVVVLRRVGWPQRHALERLAGEEQPFITQPVRLYLRDTLDHIAQVVELLDTSRDVAIAVTDLYLSTVGNRTNEIMKVLTLMASIFIPLTFIAGIYGMNFDEMPGVHTRWAFPLLIGLMTIMGLLMLFYFRTRGWIGERKDRDDLHDG